MLLIGCGSVVLSACGDNNDNMSISLSESQVEIVLGENDNIGKIYATVENASNKTVSVQYDSQSIQVSVGQPSNKGISEITIKALRACQNVEVFVNGANKSTSFIVNATLPVSEIIPNQSQYPLSYDPETGGTFTLSQDLFTVRPEGTSQTGLLFNLLSDNNGISLENNILTIQPGLSDVPDTITVEVVSAHKDSVRTTITIDVVKAIAVDSIQIVDESGAPLNSVEISRTSSSKNVVSIYIRVPYSITTEKLNITPKFAYNDKGIVLDSEISYPVANGGYYEYVFNFTLLTENTQLGQDIIWFTLNYVKYPNLIYSTANAQNGRVSINVIDEIRDISITSDGVAVNIDNSINLYTTYSTGIVEGYALTFSADPPTATSAQLSLNISTSDLNYLIVRDQYGNIVEFTNGQYLFDSGETFYFLAKNGFTPGETVNVIVKSEKENVDIQKSITFALMEGVTSLGFINDAGDGILATREFYLDTNEHSSYMVQVAVAPTSIDLTDVNVVEIYSTTDAFSVGQIVNTAQVLNGAAVYTVEIYANESGTGELVIKFVSGQSIRATVNVIDNLSDVIIDVDPNFSTSTAVGNIVRENSSLVYVALKNGQSLPLTFTGDSQIESVSFNFVDYIYDENSDDVYDANGAYVAFGNNQPLDDAFTSNNSNVISANYLRSLRHLSPITVGKVWIRITFVGKQIVEENGQYVYTDIQISKYLLVEVYNPIISVEVDTREVSLYPADELGQDNVSLSQQVITLTVNRGTVLPTYNLLEIENMPTYVGDGLYQYFLPGGEINFEIERINDYQFIVRAFTRNDDGTDGLGETEFESTVINFVSRDLNLERYKYSISVVISMHEPQLVEEVEIENVGDDGIYLMAQNLTTDIGFTSFKLVTSVLPSNALNKGVVYRFFPDNGTLSTIISISEDGLIKTTGVLGGSGKIRVIPKDSVFIDENGHEYYRDGYVYAEVAVLVADGRSRETAIRINSLNELTDSNLHYILLNNVTYSEKSQIFGVFTGGLYGSIEEGASDVAVITLNGGSNLFGTLSVNAIIADLSVVGNTNSSSMFVDTNAGTIKNVSVDVFTQDDQITPSSVTYTEGNAGGIAQINTGIIKNAIFAGNISATQNGSVVGGIVGVNYGQILNSSVLFYNLENGATTKINGTTVGMLVGELAGSGIIEKSYAYNFSEDTVSSSQNVGAVAGIISSVLVSISECFVDVGEYEDFYSSLGENVEQDDISSIIADSYTIAKSNDGQILFTYYMTNILKNTISGQYSNNDTQTYPNVGMNTSTALWYNEDKDANYGFPYLNNVRPSKAITSDQLASLRIVQSRLSLAENGDTQSGYEAIMFFYHPEGVILTDREQQVLNTINTISYGELFGTYSLGGLIVTSSNSSVISTATNGLIVKNTGKTTLTIRSRYDYSVGSRQVNVNVIYQTSGFALSYKNQNLGSSSTINIRTRVNETLVSSVTSSIVLVDREIPLMQNNFVVRYVDENEENVNFVIGSQIGTHTIVGSFQGENITLNVYLSLDGLSQNNALSLRQFSQKTLMLQKIYGPVSLISSLSSATISASDNISVLVEITSDTKYLDSLTGRELVVEILNSNNEPSDDVLYEISYNQLLDEITNLDGTTTRRYTITLRLDTKLVDFDSNYVVKFSTDSPSEYDAISATLNLTVLEQEVLRVDVNHYAYRGASSVEGVSLYNYYPNNVLSPGTTGLLDVMVYPAYAKYTHITVTGETQNGQSLSFLNMRKEGQGYRVNLANTFEYITNGIKVYKVSADSEVARYYIRVKVPESVEIDSTFLITITVYNEEEVVYTLPYSLIIIPQERAGITVDGQSSIYAVRGDTITADVVWDQTQNIKFIDAVDFDDQPVDGVTVPPNISDADKEEYATSYYHSQINITIGESSGHFRIRVATSRTINGVEQVVYSYLTVYVIDFELDFNNTHIANEDGSDVATGDQYFYHTLDFNFGGRYVDNEDGSISFSENAYNSFVENNYYANGDYIVNTTGVQNGGSLLYNLYYVDGTVYTPVVTSSGNLTTHENAIVKFVIDGNNDVRFIGTQNGTQHMMLQMRVQMPDMTMFTYSYYFTIVISDPTSDDSPAQISNAQEFLDALNGDTAEDYILTQDIYLYDYTPAQDTSKIRSLDGNGYQIVIVGFNYDNTQSQVDLSLFNVVDANTTLKNLRVNIFHVGTITITSAFTKTVNVAPIAITNNGIITNCEVVSYRKLTNEVAPTLNGLNVEVDSTIGVSARTAGFVISNNGIITNSRVGGSEAVEYIYDTTIIDGEIIKTGAVEPNTYILSPFVISSFGEISGFVYQNSENGHIVSSYASNIRIINNSNIDYTTITAGFVINNSGLISASYSKGVKQSETDIHATFYGIETSGTSAGFVYENSGEINNSYSNIALTNQNNNPGRTSAGFVYRNTANGVIRTSLSLSRIIGSTTTQMNFAGVDDYGNYQNLGEIYNSYYYDEVSLSDSSILIESAYGEGATYISNITLEDYLYGFSFVDKNSENADDGIWIMTNVGPELVSANQIAVSLRYASQANTDSKPMFTYVDEYRYGSKNNPILIRSAEEFANVFSGTGNSSASRYVNAELGEIFGSYRLINDIDLSELVTDSNNTYTLASSSMTLTGKYVDQGDGNSIGKFDGNGLTISGLALSDPEGEAVNFGLFASITDGAIVQNVNLILGSTNAGGDVFGVEASGVEYVGALAGTVENSKIINITLSSAYVDSNSVTVRGKNIVGGLIGRVIGDSYIFNLNVSDISVTASMNPTNYVPGSSYISYNTYNRTSDLLNSYVSYAGGVVGAIDVYTASSINTITFADTDTVLDGNAVMLKTSGTNIISGGTVGGVVGYVGALTVLQDALYELSYVNADSYKQQGLYSYNGFAGGVVGYNGGYIRQVRSEHEYVWQIGDDDPNDANDSSIEANITKYYNGDYSVDRGNTTLFQTEGYTPLAIGGIVGIGVSGKIEKSYSKLNVINTRTNGTTGVYAGGAIGLVEATSDKEYIETNIIEVYATGDVQSYIAGGIMGYAHANIRLEKVNALNYWGKWLIESTSGTAYAIGNVALGVDVTGTANIMAFENTAIKFKDSQDNSASTITPSTDTYIYRNGISNVSPLPSYLDTISGVGDDGEMFDVYFTGNDWDKSSWERDDNELYPHIVFGYTSSVIYIRTERDIEKLRVANDGDVFVIDPDEPSPNNSNLTINGIEYIGITHPITPITSFSSLLRGLDNRSKYGFLFRSGVQQTRAIFLNTVGAVFSNFTISTYENASFTSAAISQNGVLVANAINTQFSDLDFTNLSVNLNNSVSRFGIVAGLARGSTTFSNVRLANCEITLDGQVNNSLYLGVVFGDSNLALGGVSGITLDNCNITFKNIQKGAGSSFSVGLIAGRLSSSSSTNIYMNGVDSEETGDFKGIRNSNILFTSNSSNSTTVNNINMGTLFGEASNAVLSSSGLSVNLSSENVNFVGSRIGGLIGYAQNCTLEQIEASVLMNITAMSSHIGGIAGYAQSCKFIDERTNVDISSATLRTDNKVYGINVTNMTDSESDNGNYIGGAFGTISGGTLQRAIDGNYKHAIQSDLDITVTGNASMVTIGGIVGQMIDSATMVGVESYGDIILKKTNGGEYLIRVGTIAGLILGSGKITDSYSFGDVKHVISQSANADVVDYNNISLVMAGIVAYAENNASTNVITLQDNVSAGNFYPSYQESTNIRQADTKSVSTTLASLTFGGIIATASANLNIIENISIATLFNRYDLEIATTYVVNALVGNVNEKSDDGYSYSITIGQTNYYAHVATLCTDEKYGTNVQFGSILDGISGDMVLDGGIRTIINLDDSDYTELLFNNEVGGTKLNPASGISLNTDLKKTKYIYLGSGISYDKHYSLENSVAIADGLLLVFTNADLSDGINPEAPFDLVDENSSVSGVVVVADFDSNDARPIAGLAMENEGIVYSCNVRDADAVSTSVTTNPQSNNPQKLVGRLKSESGPIAGLVGTNSGLIKDTYVSVNIQTNFTQDQESVYTGVSTENSGSKHNVAVAGLVGTNNGIVINSYTSGTIDVPNVLEKGSLLYIYLVAAGKVYDSYTNMRVVFEENFASFGNYNLTVYAFDDVESDSTEEDDADNEKDIVVNSYYDQVAAEYLVSNTNGKELTNNLSVTYSKTNTGEQSSTNIDGKESDGQAGEDQDTFKRIGSFNYDATQAYGYGSFTGEVYKNIEYMHHFTGDGSAERPYQVPNLGKLKQIEDINSSSKTYLNLINDINATYITETESGYREFGEWISLDINNISLDGYDSNEGISHKISNMYIDGVGVFDTVGGNSYLGNITLDNLISSLNSADTAVGLLANSVTDSHITGINVSSINSVGFEHINNNGNFYYGNIVGQLGQNSTLSNCTLNMLGEEDSSSINLQLGYVGSKAFVYGGLVGLATDGAVVENCNINKSFVIEPSSDFFVSENTTFIFSGVVGLLKNGLIQNCYLNGSMYALSQYNLLLSENLDSTSSGSTLLLYTGGIAGAVGELYEQNSITKVENMDNGAGRILNSGLSPNAEIYAGNSYNITTSYVGGISGFGGNIENCYNRASNVVGSAIYSFNSIKSSSEFDDFVHDESAGLNSPNVYTNLGESGYEQYDKLIYTRISQDANVAGIANSYDSVNYVVNNCASIAGGLDARYIYAYYDVDTAMIKNAPQEAMSGVLCIWLGSLFGGLLTGPLAIWAGVSQIQEVFEKDIDVNIYYFNNNVLFGSKPINSYPMLYNSSALSDSDWDSFIEILKLMLSGWGSGDYTYGINMEQFKNAASGFDLLTFTPRYRPRDDTFFEYIDNMLKSFENYKDQYGDIFNIDTTDILSQFGIGMLRDNQINYIYNLDENTSGRRNLYVFNTKAHSIGSAKPQGASTQNVAWREGVYEEKNVGGSTLYKFSDGQQYNKEYDFLWDVSDSVLNSLETVDGRPNAWDSDEWNGWSDWTYTDGDFVLSDSQEVKSTSDLDIFNNLTTIGVDSEGNDTAEITVNGIEDYRGVVNMVNSILADDSNRYTIEGIIDTDKLAKLKSAIRSGNVTIKLAFTNEISFNNMSVPSFGVDETHPFSGTITTLSDRNFATINAFIASDSNTNASLGMVAYGKDVTLERIKLTYDTQSAVAINGIKNVGGLIGTVVSGGNVSIYNCEVTLSVADRNKAGQISTQNTNVGGLIGEVEPNSTIIIDRTNVTLSTNLLGGSVLNQSNTGVGGLIGYVNSSKILINSQVVVTLNRNEEKLVSTSSNNTFGGAVGTMIDSSIAPSVVSETAISQLEINGEIDVENTTGTNIYAGGLIGYFAGNGTIDLSTININLTSISTNAGINGTFTYSAGVIGYMDDATTLPISNTTQMNIGSQSTILTISSGLGGTSFSSHAYADNIVGNRAQGFAWEGQISFNTSVLALAKPSYSPPVDNIITKPTGVDIVSAKQVAGSISEKTFSGGGEATSAISYFKIDAYEYETQVDTNIENAFMNGENGTIYNYQKNIYFILTYGTVSADAYNNQDVHNIQETVYRLNINGYRSDTATSDIITSQDIQFITAYSFSTTSDMYYRAVQSREPIDMNSRESYFVPSGITILRTTENSNGISQYVQGPANIRTVPYYQIVNNGSEIQVNINTTFESSTLTLEGDGNDATTSDDLDDVLDGLDEPPEPTVLSTVTYENIILNLNRNSSEHKYGELYLTYGVPDTSIGVPSEPLYIPKDDIIYDYGEDSSGSSLITNSIVDSMGNPVDLSGIKNTSSSRFYLKLSNGSFEIDSASMVSNSASLIMQTTVSRIMRIDGQTSRQYRAIFISFNNGFASIENMQGIQYNEYIYLVDSNETLYYLGDISYITTEEIEFTNGMPRNAMFFPDTVQIVSYKNNLLPLNKVTPVTSFADVKIEDIVTVDDQVSYFIDTTDPSGLTSIYSQIVTNTTTFNVALDTIEVKSLSNIQVRLVVNSSRDSHSEEVVGGSYAYIASLDDTNVYEIDPRFVYNESDVGLSNALNAFVLTKTNSLGSTTQIYVLSSDGGFTVYSTGFELRSDGTNSYYVLFDNASGMKYDSTGKNDVNISEDDPQDSQKFGVTYTTVGDNTVITFTKGSTTGYIQLPGTGYNLSYDNLANILTISRDSDSYTFVYTNGQFALSSHTYTIIMTEGVYTITETYDSSHAKIVISLNGEQTTVDVPSNISWEYYVANADKNNPTIIENVFDINFENWTIDYSDEYVLETQGYIGIYEKENEQAFSVFERGTLEKLALYTAVDQSNITIEAQVFVYENHNVVVFVKQYGEWKLLKGGQDVYLDLNRMSTNFVHVALVTNSVGTMLELYYRYDGIDNAGAVYDISNGYRFQATSSATATSIYSDVTLDYTIILYYPTYTNSISMSHTKVIWQYRGQTISLNLAFGVDGASLVPFNNDFAIGFVSGATTRYYTRNGYEIIGTVGGSISLIGTTSMGVSAPSGAYLLFNNASFTTSNETVKVVEYVQVRYNVAQNWYSTLDSQMSTQFSENGETDTLSRENVTLSANRVTFTETISTQNGNETETVTYNWSFDASPNMIKYYAADVIVQSPEPYYNRYSMFGYDWNITSNSVFETYFANSIILVSKGGAITKLDVVFGELDYQIQNL